MYVLRTTEHIFFDDEPHDAVDFRPGAVARFLDGVEWTSASDRAAGEATLADSGVWPVHTEKWYPLSAVLDAVSVVTDAVGVASLAAGGRRCGEGAAAGAATVPEALGALDEAYRRHHCGDAGGYGFRQIGPADGRVECSTPYPCVLDRSLVEGATLAAADSYVRLAEVSTCRDDGAERCTYEVTW